MEPRSTLKCSDSDLFAPGHPAPRLVIIDCGRTAQVILLPADVVAAPGSRFRHEGTTWVITGVRPLSKALVAKPAEH